jgi:hypothetical protein
VKLAAAALVRTKRRSPKKVHFRPHTTLWLPQAVAVPTKRKTAETLQLIFHFAHCAHHQCELHQMILMTVFFKSIKKRNQSAPLGCRVATWVVVYRWTNENNSLKNLKKLKETTVVERHLLGCFVDFFSFGRRET